MSELVQIWCVIVGGLCFFGFLVAMFSCNSGQSNFETFVDAWKEKRISELGVEHAKIALERDKFGLVK
jgi:hypothetical protein